MKKSVFILLVFFWMTPSSFAQLKTYSFEETEKLAIQNPKPIFVFIHTSWCNYCKMIENSTFKNPEVIKLMNENFYFVPLDAEKKNPITFNNHTFKYKPKGPNSGVHELAEALGTIESVVSYPSICVINSNLTIIHQQNSYIDSKTLLILLIEISKGH